MDLPSGRDMSPQCERTAELVDDLGSNSLTGRVNDIQRLMAQGLMSSLAIEGQLKYPRKNRNNQPISNENESIALTVGAVYDAAHHRPFRRWMRNRPGCE